ncbi:hypothetical protein [Natranaerobius trueperi]|uniref:Uncharacterized protein n=1 Tax=Natranaerobius trueperi TaxID=759412 RepID=A0A226BYM7_9FIRM|nr:hypothetical protein [Natranaerobius trueperi]OWZ84106.1 hypothetical protein CDO51_05165 [Natranaerobius trueperi]
MDITYSTINLYYALKEKYPDYLKPEITSVMMIQSEDDVWLEILEERVEDVFEKQTIRKSDLSFIVEDEEEGEPFFNPEDPIEQNAKRLLEDFSTYSIINTMDLFHEEACERICKKYNTFGVDEG